MNEIIKELLKTEVSERESYFESLSDDELTLMKDSFYFSISYEKEIRRRIIERRNKKLTDLGI